MVAVLGDLLRDLNEGVEPTPEQIAVVEGELAAAHARNDAAIEASLARQGAGTPDGVAPGSPEFDRADVVAGGTPLATEVQLTPPDKRTFDERDAEIEANPPEAPRAAPKGKRAVARPKLPGKPVPKLQAKRPGAAVPRGRRAGTNNRQ